MKNLIINVDDLGFSSAVNQAVINLAEKKRIHATSFMSLGEIKPDETEALHRLNIEIGLHFDLTGLAQRGTLKQILLKAYLGQFSTQELENIVNQQLDEFENKIARVPSFIDGHQHVHQFPQIRQVLLRCLEKRYADAIPIRNTQTYQTELKAKIIYFLGGQALKKQLIAKKWPHNTAFAGIYSFNATREKLKILWQDWLKNAPDHSVIMCHPALADATWNDAIYQARTLEYDWLMSDDFMALWQHYECAGDRWDTLSYQ